MSRGSHKKRRGDEGRDQLSWARGRGLSRGTGACQGISPPREQPLGGHGGKEVGVGKALQGASKTCNPAPSGSTAAMVISCFRASVEAVTPGPMDRTQLFLSGGHSSPF